MKKIKYDIKKYNFAKKIKEIYEVKDISMIHKEWKLAKKYDLLNNVKEDQSTVYHKHFYENIFSTSWSEIYHSFIHDIIRPIFDEAILYQTIPTFRIHQPANIAVAAFHKDSDYSHSIHEVNFYLPLTNAYGNNTVWVESKPGEEDFSPMEGKLGDVWMWDGANLLHGNKINDTNFSRVSVDFRVLPMSKYVDNNKTSVTNNTKMIVGEYYSVMK